MPPTVAQTAPAFADAAGEWIGGPSANFAHRAEYEDRSIFLPKLLPLAQDFHDELHGYKDPYKGSPLKTQNSWQRP
jgi:hypothetical protein